MGAIKPWGTVYPSTIDDVSTSMPTVVDVQDDVIASHVNSLRNASIALQQEMTGYKDNVIFTAATLEHEDQLDVERVIGSVLFDGGALYNLLPHLRAIAIYKLNGGLAQGNLRVRIYDMGPPGTPLLPPQLRSTVSVSNSNDGLLIKAQQVLTLSASPGINANQIHNSLRLYEFRIILDGAPSGATATIQQAGFAVGVTQ